MKRKDHNIKLQDPIFTYMVGEQRVSNIAELDLSARSIKSFEGMKHFTNLIKLSVNDNPCWEIDLSKNRALRELACSNRQQNMSVNCTARLEYLQCNRDDLDTILCDRASLKRLSLHALLPEAALPKVISELHNLQNLEVIRMGLSDLSAIYSLKELKSLDLAFNRLSELPSEIISMDLVELRLRGNPFNELPESLHDEYKVVLELSYGQALLPDGTTDELWTEQDFYLTHRTTDDQTIHERANGQLNCDVHIVHEWDVRELLVKINSVYDKQFSPSPEPIISYDTPDGLPF